MQIGAIKTALKWDPDGTVNPSRVCLGQLCLVPDGPTGMILQSKNRAYCVARCVGRA